MFAFTQQMFVKAQNVFSFLSIYFRHKLVLLGHVIGFKVLNHISSRYAIGQQQFRLRWLALRLSSK